MKLSIVTISFNQVRFLRACIESVSSQDHPDLQHIVVDAGSSDGSRELILQHSRSVHKHIFEPDDGPADGLNKGFSVADGDVFGYINADDMMLPDAARFVIDYFETHPDVDVICGNGLRIDSAGCVQGSIFSTDWDTCRYAYGAVTSIQPATFFRRHAFVAARGFNRNNRTCWDGELLVDMACSGARIARVPRFLGAFRLYEDSISGSGRLRSAYLDDSRRIRKKVLGRDWRWSDSVMSAYYRAAKAIRSRASALSRLQGKGRVGNGI